MTIIDTHCHLYKQYYDDINDVIIKSNKLNVNYFINSGVDSDTNKEVLKLSSNCDNMYCTLGIHPEYSEIYKPEDLDYILENSNNSKVVAIGEIGLDYHYDDYNRQKQIELFEKQLQIAEKCKLPVVIHSRQATSDTIEILKKYQVKGVIHCFSGSYETAMEYIKLGFVLGVNGVVTFKNSKLKDVIKKVGIEHWILETDSPYLTPEPYRGLQNIPGNTYYVAMFLSDFLDFSINEVIKVTNTNAKRVFDKVKL